MTAEVYDLTCCPSGLAFKSELLRRPEAHHGFLLKLSHHGGKNTALRAEKHSSQLVYSEIYSRGHGFFSEAQRNGVFSSDVVFCCAATSDDGGAGVKAGFQTQSHDISTKARRAKTSSEGF